MRFRFPLEVLLNWKRTLEETSQMRLAEKMNRLKTQEEAIQRVKDEREAAEDTLKEKARLGIHADEYLSYRQFTEACYDDLLKKEEEKVKRKKEVEEEQKVLINLMKERKSFERLKEKQFARFKYEMEKLERKNMDDLVITRHRLTSKVNSV